MPCQYTIFHYEIMSNTCVVDVIFNRVLATVCTTFDHIGILLYVEQLFPYAGSYWKFNVHNRVPTSFCYKWRAVERPLWHNVRVVYLCLLDTVGIIALWHWNHLFYNVQVDLIWNYKFCWWENVCNIFAPFILS